MRFKTYLKENDEHGLTEIIQKIKQDCKPFINDLKKTNKETLFMSGRCRGTEDIVKRTIRKDRRPKDTLLKVHEYLDSAFYRKFGVKTRSNSMFITSDYRVALSYGNVYTIFPIDNYKIIWSPKIFDLYSSINRLETKTIKWTVVNTMIRMLYSANTSDQVIYYNYNKTLLDKYRPEEITDDNDYIRWLINYYENALDEIVDNYREGDLNNALKSMNEVSLVCDEVYMIKEGLLNNPYMGYKKFIDLLIN